VPVPHVKRRVTVAGTLALLASFSFLASPTSAPAAVPEATLAVTTPQVAPGQTLSIHGEHWPRRTTLHAVLCGANAIDGSVDCVEQAAITIAPGPTGVVDGSMQVVAPPEPCPCVVLVTDLASTYESRLPVTILGVPTAAIDAEGTDPGTALQVDARLTGGTTLGSLFGVSTRRTLVVTLRNTGAVRIDAPAVTARWGRRSRAEELVGSAVAGDLPPGATRTVEIDVELGAPTIGGYTVAGAVAGAGTPITFRTTTSTWPWGWLLVVQAALLAGRNAIRRRIIWSEARARRAERAADRRHARHPEGTTELLR
jgi:hypothetical protein